ncbi:MAG: 23S rRNA (pseudouridine(1915)-N(3))-methyltransferase RlmH [Clostridia bacterium]|nr:23S rRNA (pseudouridine(1915)-N(3))-methyltransferase RlmH [Clostridia bacterium]
MPLKIKILTPGRARTAWLQAGIDEYIKRLTPYCRVSIVSVSDAACQKPAERVIEEGQNLLRSIRDQDYVIALDSAGQQPNSEALAASLTHWFEMGGSSIVFVIGGAYGLSEAVLQRAQERLSLSRLTFTHQMTQLLLLEQCYRAFRITRNEPYHK